MQLFAVAAGVAAVVGLAGLTVSQNIRANNADVRADSLANAAQLATRPDARMVEVGPVQEISAPGEEHLYVMGEGVPSPPAGSVYRVWLVADGVPTFAGDFVPEGGEVFLDVAFDPSLHDDLWISIETLRRLDRRTHQRRLVVGRRERRGRLSRGHARCGVASTGAVAGRPARRNPRNITPIPVASATEKAASNPRAANADPNPAITVAPRAISSVPTNRSLSSRRPRMRQADQSVPPSNTR